MIGCETWCWDYGRETARHGARERGFSEFVVRLAFCRATYRCAAMEPALEVFPKMTTPAAFAP
jgi:hypothetical protein